ncbi:nuclear transport factor 2 family protein [Amycolatopsis australiensis]|uniref:SnoaL-like domain-containing protein n=1 Tax=Amycolatopsis australiensis TaxID=546364 RepID=A0A1K1S4K3_9PSEU|nr:nuclear transport factor 2 family protein [Amycolatopsis australiensis]SFW79004.1 SnoaL-like domain-containing protein [Amycolatopsis australiensis]
MQVATEDVVAVHQLYGRQSHAIDSGDAAGWAATFTADGEFRSPTYPEPATGTAELTAFAERFHAAGEHLRHVVSTIHVRPGATPDTLRADAYLQIVASTHLVRLTVLDDELARTGGGWRVRRRTVHRDS